MTVQELIESDNKAEIAKYNKLLDEINQKDINQKLFVIKVYLICKGIVIVGACLMLIKHFN